MVKKWYNRKKRKKPVLDNRVDNFSIADTFISIKIWFPYALNIQYAGPNRN